MKAAIEKLGSGTPKAGPSGVLRVLISYPAGFNQTALTSNARKAPDPIATVNLAKLVEQTLGSGTQEVLAVRLEAAAQQKKRKREEAAAQQKKRKREEAAQERNTRQRVA
jgi:hypothetical protein